MEDVFFFKYSLDDVNNWISKTIASRETDRLINSVSYSSLRMLAGRFAKFELVIFFL